MIPSLIASSSGWSWVLPLLSVAGFLASTATVLDILRRRREPMNMLAWILAVLLLPLLGPMIYWLLGEPRKSRRTRRRRGRRRRARSLGGFPAGGSSWQREREETRWATLAGIEPQWRDVAEIFSRMGEAPITDSNRVRVFVDAGETYEELTESFERARHHIHLEYYLFRPDETGTIVRDCLVERARQGVEVRLLLDGIGSFGTPRRFLNPLREAGGEVATFLPAIPLRSRWNINYRNHRKIVVVDGRVAFTGSQNIGDEYRGLRRRVAPWKDTHLRVEGPAVEQLQRIFIEDWYFATERALAPDDYLPTLERRGGSLVQIVPSGLDQPQNLLEQFVVHAVSRATRTVRISTPYFVPDPGVLLALKTAAMRGVEVEILIPSRTNHRLVLWAGRSYYEELLLAGVRIHEHPAAMLHSKVVTIDGQWALVGSANMDIRSFLLNFEASASIFDPEIAAELDRDFEETRRDARPVEYRARSERPLLEVVLEGAARICSPLL